MANKKDAPKHKTTYDIADELGIMALTPSAFVRHAMMCAKVGKPVLVLGRPGVGKTEIIQEEIARALNKMLYVERFNGKDPTDLGLPYLIDDVAGFKRHNWSLPYWFRSVNEALEDGYAGGWLFFGDEFAQALPAMQNRIGEMLNEKQLNGVKMHPKMTMMLAANFAQDKAATYPIPRQILNRCSVVILAPDDEDFRRWGSRKGIRPEILAFSKLFPEALDSYDPDAHVNCTPRSLASLSPLMDQRPSYEDELPLYSSVIGKGFGSQFTGFLRIYRDLPKLEDIVKNPHKEPIPDEDQTDVMCALAAMLGRAINEKNVAPVVTYLKRLPSEFCVFAMRDASRNNPDIKKTKPFVDWAISDGDVLT